MVPSTLLDAQNAVAARPEEDRTALCCHRCSEGLAALPRWAEHCRWHRPKKVGLQGALRQLEVAQLGLSAAPTSVHSVWTGAEGRALREGPTQKLWDTTHAK